MNSTLNFGIPPVLVLQLKVCYRVDRWYSNKTSLISIFEIQKKSTNITEFILSIYEKWNTRLIHFYLCWKQVLLKQEKEFQSNFADFPPKSQTKWWIGLFKYALKNQPINFLSCFNIPWLDEEDQVHKDVYFSAIKLSSWHHVKSHFKIKQNSELWLAPKTGLWRILRFPSTLAMNLMWNFVTPSTIWGIKKCIKKLRFSIPTL